MWSLPRPYFWPTISVDFLANLPLLILWAFYVFDYENAFQRRDWSRLGQPWETFNYMEAMKSTPTGIFLFSLWTVQVLFTVSVVYFHMAVRHHPKFYVGPINRLAITCHIIGGTTASFGGYIAFLISSPFMMQIASLAGLCLHMPSTFWQSRNLHGRRELMQPAYYFLGCFLFFKYSDVWFEQGSLMSILCMGLTVNSFAMVRVYFKLMLMIGMDYELSYDRSLIFAAVTNLPIAMGSTACAQLLFSIFAWNVLLEILQPDKRKLLQVNRTVADIFPDEFMNKKVDFAKELAISKKKYEHDGEAVARAAFHVIAGENETIEMEEIEALFEFWGLPDAKQLATSVFVAADANHDGHVDYEEFMKELWFIWERLFYVGEVELDQEGNMHVSYVQPDANAKKDN